MKLILVLLAVCCSALVSSAVRSTEWRKLQEVLRELDDVKAELQNSEKMINTPALEDCCSPKALECYRANMRFHFDVTEKKKFKLYKSLQSKLIIRAVDFCNAENSTDTCSDCDSYPKAKADVFFSSLESLIQKAISRLGD